MQQYSWPGNVRELQNVVERCVILADDEVLQVDTDMLTDESPSIAPTVISTIFRSDRRVEIETVLRETNGRVYGPRGAAARRVYPRRRLILKFAASALTNISSNKPTKRQRAQTARSICASSWPKLDHQRSPGTGGMAFVWIATQSPKKTIFRHGWRLRSVRSVMAAP
jgi:DNA-binding NtrC family response regulator